MARNPASEPGVSAQLVREVEDLLARAALMRRSREALVRCIVTNPAPVVSLVVRAASDSPGVEARTAAAVLRSAIRRSSDGEVARHALDELLARPVRFPELGVELCATLLATQRGRKPLDPVRLSLLWHRLGQFQAETDEPELAISSARRSLHVLRRIRSKLTDSTEAIAIRTLGLVEHLESAGRVGAAIRAARRAVRFTRLLRRESGRRIHALLLVCLGTSLAAGGRYREAHAVLEDGYQRLQRLLRNDNHQGSQLAHAAIGLAGVCLQRRSTQHLQRAGELADEAWEIHCRLAAENRGAFLRDYLSTSLLAGVVAARQGDLPKAKARRELAVTHFIRLAKHHPEAYTVELAWHLVHVSQAFLSESDLRSALRWSRTAVRTARKAERNRQTGIGEILAVSLLVQAMAHQRLKQRAHARRCAEAAGAAAMALPRRHADRKWLIKASKELGGTPPKHPQRKPV